MTTSILSFALLAACSPQATEPPEPFEAEMERLRTVDPTLMAYAEVGRVPVPAEDLHAIAAQGDRMLVAADRELLTFEKRRLVSRLELEAPATCLAVGDEDRIYLGLGDHVEVLEADGTRHAWPPLSTRSRITSIAPAANHVWVADAGNRQVLRHGLDGALLARLDPDDPDHEFVVPSPYFDVAVSATGELWVVNPGKQRVEGYSADGAPGRSWGEPGAHIEAFSGCCNPTHLALLPDGSFVTSEKGLPRIKVYDPSGRLASVVAAPDQLAEDVVGLDLAVDPAGGILVLDPHVRAVRVFERRTQANPGGDA